MINRNYDSDIFIVSTERKEIALLPNIGRFCKCGCGKRIEGKKVKRTKNGKTSIYFLKPDPDQVFATKACKFRFYNRLHDHKSKSSINALISLKVQPDKIPYRELTLYLKYNSKHVIKITSEHKELWNILEKICKYRYTNPQPKIEKENEIGLSC